jgi:carboxylesterase type B
LLLKMLQAWNLLFVAGLSIAVSIPRNDGPIAKTSQATYVGFTDTTYNVDIWTGIPYAKPPLGSRRLQPPEAYDADGTIIAQTVGNRCFEVGVPISPPGFVGGNSEDCLVLNIYTPSKNAGGKRWLNPSPPWPVMFYAHGGGFNQGSGNDYAGQSLVNHSVELKSPVVVVTINYRLSFFGFSGMIRIQLYVEVETNGCSGY